MSTGYEEKMDKLHAKSIRENQAKIVEELLISQDMITSALKNQKLMELYEIPVIIDLAQCAEPLLIELLKATDDPKFIANIQKCLHKNDPDKM